MHASIDNITRMIARVMLAGPPDGQGVVARMSTVLGDAPSWAFAVARAAIARFGDRWAVTEPAELSRFVAGSPGFVSAWHSDNRPVIVRIALPPPEQKPLPPALAASSIPRLPALGDLAKWLDMSASELGWFADHWRVSANSAKSPLHHYHYRAFDKRSGGCRLIEIPKARLRKAQERILRGLLDHIAPHDAAHGFCKGRGIVSYAAPHVDHDVVIRFDLADFFVSIRAARVHALFNTLGYPENVARALTALCTNRVPSARLLEPDLRDRFDWSSRQRYHDRHLPQGAPTSPALANLCAFRFDTRLAALAASLGAVYTRYADDLALSGDAAMLSGAVERLPALVGAIAIEEGFALQWRKTRVMRRGARQQLAGVVVNQHTNLARDTFDTLKAVLTNCVRHGPASQNHDAHSDFRAYLAGCVAYAGMLNKARGAKLRGIFDKIVWDAEAGK